MHGKLPKGTIRQDLTWVGSGTSREVFLKDVPLDLLFNYFSAPSVQQHRTVKRYSIGNSGDRLVVFKQWGKFVVSVLEAGQSYQYRSLRRRYIKILL